MKKADKDKTAFICPLGFDLFERMPEGICGAPATFQRLMEQTVGDMNLMKVLMYLDDLIVFGQTLEEHEEWLLKVLNRLKEEGLKLSLDKCKFCHPSVSYVGHIGCVYTGHITRNSYGNERSQTREMRGGFKYPREI